MRTVLRLVVVLSFVWVAAGEVGAAEVDHSAWVGDWTLDKSKSDPPDKMLEVMEVPWYLRSLAKAFTPTLGISTEGAGLAMATKTPLGSRTQNLRADGKAYPGSDQLDHKFEQSSTWEANGHFLVDRTTELPSGKKATVQSDWSLQDDTLTNDMKVAVTDTPPFEVRRVFARDPKE